MLGTALALSSIRTPLNQLFAGASVALDFTNSRYRLGASGAETTDPTTLSGWTITRASGGYAEDTAGNLSWFYGPRTNFAQWSQTFTNGSWATIYGSSVSTQAQADPLGTTSAVKIVTTGNTSWGATVGGLTTSQTYAASIWVRADAPATLNLELYDGTTVKNTSISVTTAWQRFTAFQTIAGTILRVGVQNGVSTSFYLFGAQVESGSVATPYIATTSAAVTTSAQPRITNKGLLVEEARTNLALQSQALNGAPWSGGISSVVNNTTIAPDGTLTGSTLTYAATGGWAQTITVSASTTYTLSFYALRGTATDAKYSVLDVTHAADIVSSTSYYSQINATTWKRVSVTFTTPAGCTSISLYPLRDAGVSGTVAIWGVQLEAAAFATSYVPTTTAAATRPADLIYLTGITGTPQGTWVLDFLSDLKTTTGRWAAFNFSDGGYPTGTGLEINTNGAATMSFGGNGSAINTTSFPVANVSNRFAATWNVTGTIQRSSINGLPVTGNATLDYTATGVARLALGSLQSNTATSPPNGYLQRFAYYTTQSTDAALQSLSAGLDLSALNLAFASGSYKTTTPYSRSNLIPNSATGTAWNKNNITIGPSSATVLGKPMWLLTIVTAGGTGVTNFAVPGSVNAAVGQSYTLRMAVQGVGATVTNSIGLYGSVDGWGLNANAAGRIISGPGTLSQSSGGLWTIAGLSTSVPTIVEIIRTSQSAQTLQPYLYVSNTGGGLINGGEQALVGIPQLEPSTTYGSSYIETTGSAVTVATTAGTNLSDIGALTVTRASTGYARDIWGNLISFPSNVPRITNLGLLVEEARTNLFTQSSTFTNAVWFKQNINVAASTVAGPDGTPAYSITPTTSADPSLLSSTITVANATAHTLTIIGKAGSPWSWFELDTQDGGGALQRTWFNFSNCTVGTVGHTSANIRQLANGFCAASVTWTTAATTTKMYLEPRTANNNSGAVTGDGATVAFYPWAAQLEAGAFATSYIPTTSAAATRAADSIVLTGITTGLPYTLAVQATPTGLPVSGNVDLVNSGPDVSNLQGFYLPSGQVQAYVYTAGTITANINAATTVTANTSFATAARFNTNAVNLAVNNTLGTQDITSAPVSMSNLNITAVSFGGTKFNGYMQQINVYPYAANDAELQYRSAGNF